MIKNQLKKLRECLENQSRSQMRSRHASSRNSLRRAGNNGITRLETELPEGRKNKDPIFGEPNGKNNQKTERRERKTGGGRR
jgi:hypothetical protein